MSIRFARLSDSEVLAILPLSIFCDDLGYGGHSRTLVEPACQLIERIRTSACKDLDVSAAQIDGVSRNAERFGNASRAVAKKHALNTAFDRELTRTWHEM